MPPSDRGAPARIAPGIRFVIIFFLFVDARQKKANVPRRNVMLADVAKR